MRSLYELLSCSHIYKKMERFYAAMAIWKKKAFPSGFLHLGSTQDGNNVTKQKLNKRSTLTQLSMGKRHSLYYIASISWVLC